MTALATFVNSFLGNQMHNPVPPPDLVPAAAGSVPAAKKVYSFHHEGYDEHPSYVHHYNKIGYNKKKSRSVALSALTLLAFLFFLHILQQCIQDHQTADYYQTTTVAPQVVIKLKAAREAEKEAQKRVGDTPAATEEEEGVGVVGSSAGSGGLQDTGVLREGADLYQYGKVHHVPVKMTMVERRNKKQ